MPNYAQALREILPHAPVEEVAELASHACVEAERLPYCFSINHNVGAPKFAPCPLTYDFRWGKTVGIKTHDKQRARNWIRDALIRGYTVTRAGSNTSGIKDHEPYGDAWEIGRIRDRAKRHQTPRTEADDDIPF